MRLEPRSGHTTPESTSRKCGATSQRTSCSLLSLRSAKTIQSGRVPSSFALMAMRRTMPSDPGAVEIWIWSPSERERWTKR